jgi:hypothetical protein
MAVASGEELAHAYVVGFVLSLPVEVEGPEGYYCQHLYLPELNRWPTKYMIYHGCTLLVL